MKIGDWEIRSFVAGKFRLDGGAMFGVVPKNIWNRVTPADEENRIAMVMRPMVIRGKDRTIIVDAGSGSGYGDKIARIYGFEISTPMPELLAPLGLSPEDVTDVIVTHLHFDHAGGVAYNDERGWKLTFPNAVHHVQDRQWRHALAPNPRDRASYFRERIEIIENEGTLELHDGEWSLAPGLDLHVCHGHTPGQQLPKVTGGGKTLFFCGDLCPFVAHFPTPYIMSYDLEPVRSMEEKQSMLTQASSEGWILFFEHDPEVEACTVHESNGRFTAGEKIQI